MLEVLKRSGMGRTARWSHGGRVLGTPNVLYVDAPGFPAPAWAEAVATRGTPPPGTIGFATGGSFFVPVAGDGDLRLPERSGLPHASRDLEIPRDVASGPLALVSSLDQLPSGSAAEVVFLENGPALLDRPRDFVRGVVEFRSAFGPGKVLGIPGIASPEILAILVYSGVDLVDSSRVLLDTARGLYLTHDGALPRTSLEELPCRCPSCLGEGSLLEHNLHALHEELAVVRTAIRHGALRELSERRAGNDPWGTAVLREFDLRNYEFQEPHFPVSNGHVRAYSPMALSRPDVVRFRRFVGTAYRRPPSPRVLVLLPCSARKPYADSMTHRRYREAIDASGNPAAVHEAIVTSPLGVVPRELERAFPAAHYDVPVTGDWSQDEASMLRDGLRAFLANNPYGRVIAHVSTEAPIVRDAAPDAEFTAKGRPASEESLAALAAAAREAVAGMPRISWPDRRREDVASLARLQFGPAGDALLEGADLRGRWPFLRILRGREQLGMVTDRGGISLTLSGGGVLASHGVSTVEIEDFLPKGNVFAVGVVRATADVREGSEVAVVHGGDVRAVGVARMNAREMSDLERGEAVRVRHRAVPPNP